MGLKTELWKRALAAWVAICTVGSVGALVARADPGGADLTVSAGAPEDGERSPIQDSTTSVLTLPTADPTTASTTSTAPAPTAAPRAAAGSGRAPTTTTASATGDAPAPSPLPCTLDPVLLTTGKQQTIFIGPRGDGEVLLMAGYGMMTTSCSPQVSASGSSDRAQHWRPRNQPNGAVRMDYQPTSQAWIVRGWWDGTQIQHSAEEVPYEILWAGPGSGIRRTTELGSHMCRIDVGGISVDVAQDSIKIRGGTLSDGWEFFDLHAIDGPIVRIKDPSGGLHTVMAARSPAGEIYAIRLD